MNKPTYIIGSGGLGFEVNKLFEINGIKNLGHVVTNNEYITDNEILLTSLKSNSNVIIAIGSPNIKKIIYETYIQSKLNGSIIIDKSVNFIGDFTPNIGFLALPNSTITGDVEVGKFVTVDKMACISHGSKIGDFSQISPMSIISGDVTIGKGCFIGTGAMIKEKVNICDNVIIGMGSVVLNDITEPGTYVGNKLRKIK